MRDKRPVDELSIEELERVLAVKKREQRMARAQRYRDSGRTVDNVPAPPEPPDVPVETAVAAVEPPPEPPRLPEPRATTDFEHVAFVDDGRKASDPSEIWRRLSSWGLLAVEGVAVLALVYVLYQGFTGLDSIQDTTNETQQELATAQAVNRVTPTAMPQISPYNLVIPGGHIYDEDSPQFNFAELEAGFDANNIPVRWRQDLRDEVDNRTVPIGAEPLPNSPVEIAIPKIGVPRSTVFQGADWETLTNGLGWFPNGANLSNGLNVVIVGHNDIYGEIFRYLEDLSIGDEISVYDNNGREYTYRVTREEQVFPTEVRVLEASTGADLTLITCTPYRVNDRRHIVYAERVSS